MKVGSLCGFGQGRVGYHDRAVFPSTMVVGLGAVPLGELGCHVGGVVPPLVVRQPVQLKPECRSLASTLTFLPSLALPPILQLL